MAASMGHGVSKPISLTESSEDDIKASEELLHILRRLDVFEDEDGMQKRDELLEYLDAIVKQWVCLVAEKQGRNKDSCGSRVMPFGGHLLSVVTKDGDMDAVCVVPDFVPREEFFLSFVSVLKAECGQSLRSLRLVEGARVPIVQMCLKGYQVDLCVARLSADHVPDHLNIGQDDILKGMNITDIRSLNGTRDTSRILDLVPDTNTFRTTLKAVKLWAKAKGIHNCPMGYPGGIAWAIMVARICQLYPNAAPATILCKFFILFKEWRWPSPVIISPLTRKDTHDLKPWNPKLNPADTTHVMPIITPSYPEKNCAFTVTRSGLKIVTKQLASASQLVDKILSKEISWDVLFEKLDFFSLYKHFLMVTAHAACSEDQLYWSGLVHARSRVFVEDLEKQTAIEHIHAYPKTWENGWKTKWFWGLQFTEMKGIRLSLAEDLRNFQKHYAIVSDLAKERGFYRLGMGIEVNHIRRKDLKSVLPEENFT